MSPEQALKRLQEAELEILLAISEVCEKAQVNWWMDSGTALGAMRHGGFIPWDDDIDIGILRSDYDRFLEVAPRLLPEGFSLHTARDTKGFAPLFAKVFLDGTRFETARQDLGRAFLSTCFPMTFSMRIPRDARLRFPLRSMPSASPISITPKA